MFVALFTVVCFLAYSNGANDNFKGVATLFGSRTSDYRTALWWASGATFAGAIVSILFSRLLVVRFSGQGLVPSVIAQFPAFLLSVALGAGLTVITATVLGFPVSTTHGLVGALVGAGLIAAPSQVQLAALTKLIMIPLLLSPIAAVGLCYGLYRLVARAVLQFDRRNEICICTEDRDALIVSPAEAAVLSAEAGIMRPAFSLRVATKAECAQRPGWPIMNFRSDAILDSAHYLSAGLVSFARGMNDTPKIAALLSWTSIPLLYAFIATAIVMLGGGLLNARKVATTMSNRITPLTPAQGFAANLVTGTLGVFASRIGIPVSTTHVAVGSLFGAGVANGLLNKRTFTQIIFAWLLTLPMAAVSAALLYLLLR